MNGVLLRGCLGLLVLGVGVFGATPAYAARVQCKNPQMTALSFGTVDPQSTQTNATATFTITCGNTGILNIRGATICLSIGEDRQMSSGSGTLNFQLYQDTSYAIVWGSQFEGSVEPFLFNVLVPPGGSQQFPVTLYGRVLAGQSGVTPGAYTKSYPSTDKARVTVNAPLTGNTFPGSCNTNPGGDLHFPFTVSANVPKKCTITAKALNFGDNVGLLSDAVNASTTLDVKCSNTTPYNVGLSAGQNAGGSINARKMRLAGNDIGYQLYRDSGRTQVWGETINTNTMAGIGSGAAQILTVYGNVQPQATPPAGTYNDVVTVTVTF